LNLRARRKGGRRHRNYSTWIPSFVETAGVGANPSRRRRRKLRGRKHRRNAYFTPRYVMNPRRRRRGGRRRRGLNAKFRYRGGRRRRKNYSTYLPAYGRNPRGPAAALTAGLQPQVIKALYPAAVGMLVNEVTSGMVAGFGWVPQALKAGPGRVVLNLITAGGNALAITMAAGFAPKLIKRGWAGPVFAGGVIGALLNATREMVIPGLKTAFGMGDYLSVDDARRAQALGDYLSVEDARRAQALDAYREFSQPYALHPALGQIAMTPLDMVDGVASVELATA
jgi:hypothetical protein